MIGIQVKRKKIHNVQKGLEQGYRDGLTEFLTILESDVKLLAPVDKGFLRASIFKKVKRLARKIVGVVGSNISYAGPQELGTSKMSAANQGKGYFRPAADKNKRRVGPIFGKHIRGGIRSN
jgi:hypothetical protein